MYLSTIASSYLCSTFLLMRSTSPSTLAPPPVVSLLSPSEVSPPHLTHTHAHSTRLMHAEELLTCIAESVASGELPDAASLEREVVLPGELAGSVTKSHETSRQPVQHRERAPKRKKRISNESEGKCFLALSYKIYNFYL